MKKLLLLFFIMFNAIAMDSDSIEVEIKFANCLDRLWFGFFGPNLKHEYVINRHTKELYQILSATLIIRNDIRVKKSEVKPVKKVKIAHEHLAFLHSIHDQTYTHEQCDSISMDSYGYVFKKDGSLYLDLEKVCGYDPDQMEDMFSRHFNATIINSTKPIKPIKKMVILIESISKGN